MGIADEFFTTSETFKGKSADDKMFFFIENYDRIITTVRRLQAEEDAYEQRFEMKYQKLQDHRQYIDDLKAKKDASLKDPNFKKWLELKTEQLEKELNEEIELSLPCDEILHFVMNNRGWLRRLDKKDRTTRAQIGKLAEKALYIVSWPFRKSVEILKEEYEDDEETQKTCDAFTKMLKTFGRGLNDTIRNSSSAHAVDVEPEYDECI